MSCNSSTMLHLPQWFIGRFDTIDLTISKAVSRITPKRDTGIGAWYIDYLYSKRRFE